MDYIIHSKWSEIVGKFFEQYSEPQKIISIPESNNENDETIYSRILYVDVSPSVAVEFQHYQNKITEKINSYFGYEAIKRIKIHQKFIKKENIIEKNNNKNNFKKKNEIKGTLPSKINDKKLENSVVNLGLSIKNREE